MSSKFEILIKLLKENNEYTICEVKEKLKVNNDFELSQTVIQVLDNILSSKQLSENPNKYNCILRIFNYFSFDKITDEQKEELLNGIEYIIYMCTKNIKRNVNKKKCKNVEALGIYKKILLKLNKVYEEVDNCETCEYSDEKTYQFLRRLFFEYSNYNSTEKFFEYSILEKLSKEKIEALFDELIEKYIETITGDYNCYDLLYYEKVIEIISLELIKIKNQSFLKKQCNYLKSQMDIITFKFVEATLNEDEVNERMLLVEQLIKNIDPVKGKKETNEASLIAHINYKYGIKSNFSEEALHELESYKITRDKSSKDYTDRCVISIDANGASSLEDAFSLKLLPNGNYLLGLYISNVSDYIDKNSLIDLEAYKRASTIYLPGKCITMLPEHLSHGVCSLNSKGSKDVIAYTFEFSNSLDLINYNVEKAIIKVSMNFKYSDIEKTLEDVNNLAVINTLRNAITFTQKLSNQNSSKERYHQIKTIKRILTIDNEEYLKKYENGVGNMISSEMAIFLNRFVGNYFNDKKNNYPFIYRVNNFINDDNIIKEIKTKIINEDYADSIIESIDKICMPSKYSTKNTGHAGLGFEAYCHNTNPLRSYASLLAQRAVVDFIINKIEDDNYKVMTEKNLECASVYLNKRLEMNDEYLKKYFNVYKKQLTK